MSKVSPKIWINATVIVLTLLTLSLSAQTSQKFSVHISVTTDGKLDVRGSSSVRSGPRENSRNVAFLRDQIGASGDLGERIGDLRLTSSDGAAVAAKRFIPGEYVAESDFTAWSYTVDLRPRKSARAAAHISWLGPENGVVMLDDVLPAFALGRGNAASIDLTLPDGWKVYSSETITDSVKFEVDRPDKAVFYVGKSLRQIGSGKTKLLIGGKWQFEDAEAESMVNEIEARYAAKFGQIASQKLVALLRFPGNVPPATWEAETRGSTVTIVSSDMPFKAQSLQRLHEQLRHEIFHLWVPNSLDLKGNYDWFYEGFALYESLRLAVELNRIRFDDMLSTLTQARKIDSFQKPKRSLIQMSASRLGGDDTSLYARGMLTAFFTDVAILDASKAKRSVDDLMRGIITDGNSSGAAREANDVILSAMQKYPELGSLISGQIKGNGEFDWSALQKAGLDTEAGNSTQQIVVAAKLNGRQKTILDRLGYNSWRKLTPNSK